MCVLCFCICTFAFAIFHNNFYEIIKLIVSQWSCVCPHPLWREQTSIWRFRHELNIGFVMWKLIRQSSTWNNSTWVVILFCAALLPVLQRAVVCNNPCLPPTSPQHPADFTEKQHFAEVTLCFCVTSVCHFLQDYFSFFNNSENGGRLWTKYFRQCCNLWGKKCFYSTGTQHSGWISYYCR